MEKIAIAALQDSLQASVGGGAETFVLDGSTTSPTSFYVAGTNGEDHILVVGASPAFIYLPKFGELVNGVAITYDAWKNKEFTIVAQRDCDNVVVVPGGGSYGFSYGYVDLTTQYPTLAAPDSATSGYVLPSYSVAKFIQTGNTPTATRWTTGQVLLINDRISVGSYDFHGGTMDTATVVLLNQSEYGALMVAQYYRSKVIPIATSNLSGYVLAVTDTGSDLPVAAVSMPGSPYDISVSITDGTAALTLGSGLRLLSLNFELIIPVAGEIVLTGIPMYGNYLPTLSIAKRIAGGLERVMGNPFTRSDVDGSLHITSLTSECFISLQW